MRASQGMVMLSIGWVAAYVMYFNYGVVATTWATMAVMAMFLIAAIAELAGWHPMTQSHLDTCEACQEKRGR